MHSGHAKPEVDITVRGVQYIENLYSQKDMQARPEVDNKSDDV